MTKKEKRKKKKGINFSSKLKNNNKGIPIPPYVPKPQAIVKHKGDDVSFWLFSLKNARELCQRDKNLYISEILNDGNDE